MINHIKILGNTELFSKFEFKEIETILKSSSLKKKNYKSSEAVFCQKPRTVYRHSPFRSGYDHKRRFLRKQKYPCIYK